MPPRVPVEEIADIRFDRAGRLAIIVGYAGVHRLDLDTLRSVQILADGRAERTAVVSADGRRAGVFDEYGPCLHVFDLEAGTHQTIEGSQQALRRQMKTIGPRGLAVGAGLVESDDRLTLSTDDGPVELRPPLGAFTQIRDAARCADGRVVVSAMGRCDLRAEGPSRCLFVFDAQGVALGTVHLAKRGQGASMVFYNGEAMTVAALAALGVTVKATASGEAKSAQARFQPEGSDGFDEVVFGRSVRGFLGRLDLDAPLGKRAYDHEDVARVRRALLGESPLDDAPDRCADDAAQRLRFWAEHFESVKTLTIAHQASAGLTALLPEIAHRVIGKRGKPPASKSVQRALRTVCGEMSRLTADEKRTLFQAMCDRLDAEDSAAELATLCDVDAQALYAAAEGSRVQIIRFIEAFRTGEIRLQGCRPALIELVLPRLADLVRIHCGSDPAGASALHVLQDRAWPMLSVLDAGKTQFTDEMAFALAMSRGLPRLKTLRLPASASAIARAVLAFSPHLPVTISGERTTLATLIMDQRLDDALRVGLLRAASPPNGPGLRLVAETLQGIDQRALLDVLPTHDEPLVLEGFEISSEVASMFPQSGTLRRCAFDFQVALDLAIHRGRSVPTLENCMTSPAGEVALYVLAGSGARPSVPAVNAFLRSTEPSDSQWFAVVERGLQIAPDLIEAGFAALGDPDAAVLLRERPTLLDWGLERGQTTLARAIARRLTRVSDGHRVGRLTMTRGDDWSITGISPPFTCAREPEMAAIAKLLTGQDLLIGDDEFDRAARLWGARTTALIRLDASNRAAWREALDAKIRVTARGLEGPSPVPEPALLGRLLLTIIDEPTDGTHRPVWSRLLARFETEPVGGVRGQLLGCLLEEPDVPEAVRERLYAEALADPHPGVRDIGADQVWPVVAAAPDLTVLPAVTLAAVLERLSGDRQFAAIAHLGATGDEGCVGALVEAGTGLFKSRKVRDATQTAIAEISKRIGGLRTGGLSVAQAGHGGLSTPEDGAD